MPLSWANKFTWHSCKATIIDLAACQGENPMAIGFQGHWKDPTGPMPAKYVRKRGKIAMDMVKRVVLQERTNLVQNLPQAWIPAHAWNNGTDALRHVTEACDPSVTLCRKKTSKMRMVPMPTLQQMHMFCKSCAKKLGNPCEAI
jgi:hypothetical protein